LSFSERSLTCEDSSGFGGDGPLWQVGPAVGHDSPDDGAEFDGRGDHGLLVGEATAFTIFGVFSFGFWRPECIAK
jgi:hypothetical protein